MNRHAILLVALAAAGCSSSAPNVGPRFRTPSAIAVFDGLTERHPELHPYLAVANAGNDQLTLIDPEDDRPVQSPGLVFPLAVPTESSPMFVAAAPLGDGLADALVVAGAPDPATGEVALQLVVTWDGRPRPAGTFPVGAGGEVILGLAGVPVPQDAAPVDGVVPAVPGVARFLVSLSGGRLAVVRATRVGDAIVLSDEGSLALGGVAPFDALSLSASPDGRRVYAASLEPVTGTDGSSAAGLAEIDTLGDDPAAWTVRALSARAPTYGVAAANVVERTLATPDTFDREQLTGAPRLLVYALVDPASCGALREMACGIVTIDPATGGLAEDPVGEMPFRAPMTLPVLPLAITAWDDPPAVSGGDKIEAQPEDGGALLERPGIRYTPGTGARATSALGLVRAADGTVYSLDLGRWGPGTDSSLLRAPLQTRTDSFTFTTDPRVAPQIGMWNDDPTPLAARKPGDPPPEPPELETSTFSAADALLVTPGYTRSETWALGWQYPLPGLALRHGTLVRDAGQGIVVAMQAPHPEVPGAWIDSVGLYAPLLGVHVGDVVEVDLDDAGLSADCAAVGEGRVASILPPDPVRWPGGALLLGPPVEPPVRPDVPAREDVYACWSTALAEGTAFTGRATIYSAEWLLVGSEFGYAGRPEPDVRYRVQYPGRDAEGFVEERLAVACTIPSWPPPGPEVPTCEGGCRDACEQLAMARKSRRFYYPQDTCTLSGIPGEVACSVTGRPGVPALIVSDTQTIPARPGEFDVMAPGPVIEFRFGLNPEAVTAENPIVRAANVSWRTFSGYDASNRSPTSGGQATGAIGFDRSPFTEAEPRIVFYVSYTGDAVYEAALGAFATESKTLR